MSRVRRHHTHREHNQEQAKQSHLKQAEADHTVTDELLDEIDKVLAEVDAEKQADEKASFKEKLKSISFGGRARARCDELVVLPEFIGDALGATKYEGPPCVGC